MKFGPKAVLCAFLCLAVLPLEAQETRLTGHLKLQPSYFWYEGESVQSQLGSDNFFGKIIDLRPILQHSQDEFFFDFQAEALGQASDELETAEQIRSALMIGPDRLGDDHRLFDLSTEVLRDENFDLITRVDRMSVSWSEGSTVAKLGRQTITWGNGLLFPVLDVFNPFSPTEIDKDYKSGEDMLYVQELFDSGDDIQFLILPRRSFDGGAVKDSESSYAAHYSGRIDSAELGYNLVMGRHYGNLVSGFGLSQGFLEGVARLDFLVDLESSSDQYFRGAANYDRSFVMFGFNLYAFVEYFYNSGGLDPDHYALGSESLTQRIQRGEVFTLGRDYLSVGGRVEWTPLWNMFLTQIFNLHDESGIFQIRNDYNIGDDWLLFLGLNLPYGPRGTEFGGVASPFGESYFTPGREAYIRLGYFF